MEGWHCSRCGACCRDVGLTLKEYKTLRKLSNGRERHLLESRQKYDPKLGLCIDGVCPFLYKNGDGTTYCRIYKNRPRACQWYPPPPLQSYPKCKDEYNGRTIVSMFWITGIKFLMKDGTIVDPVLTSHQETTTIAGLSAYLYKKDVAADAAGTEINVSNAAIGYKLFPGAATDREGWHFQLTNVAKILASAWTVYFRSYVSGGTAHGNYNITIRYATNSSWLIRDTILLESASPDTADFPSAYGTVSSNYAFPEYTVVAQTDWLVVQYYAHVTTQKSGKKSYLRFDDQTLAEADQVRVTNVSFLMAVAETITAKSFPMPYLEKPVKAQELISTVEGATITNVTKDFPEKLIKKGTAKELRSEWT